MRAQLSTHDYEQISAYLDEQLSSREKVRFELQLRDRPDLKTALDEMSRTRALLRMVPHRRAPRNFTLTPAMVQQSQPKRTFGFNLFPALSFASALAALVLVATVLFELMPGNSPSTSTMAGAAPEAARSAQTNDAQLNPLQASPPADAEKAAPGIAAAPEMQSALPPVITWGFPDNSGALGSAIGKGGGPGFDTLGRGGGGGGGDGYGMGGGAPDGNLVVPLDSVEALPQANAAQESAARQSFEGIPTLDGTGPILGIPSEDQAGQYTAPVATPLPARELAYQESEGSSADEPQNVNFSTLRVVQIILGLVALLTGLAAFIIWRRMR